MDELLVQVKTNLPGLRVGDVVKVSLTRYVKAAIGGGHLLPLEDLPAAPPQEPLYATHDVDPADDPAETSEAVTGPLSASGG